MRPALALLCAALVAAAPALAAASATQDLTRARGEYERGEYQKTVQILYKLLYVEKEPMLEDDLVESHKLLGISYYYLDDPEKARQEFSALLYIDPDYELDPVIEQPEVVAFFDNVKRELKNELNEIRKQRAIEEAKKQQPSVEITITRDVRYESPWGNFIPFGYGQFRNGQSGWGTVYLVTEGALAAISTGLFVAQAIEFGFPVGRRPAEDEIERVRLMQTLQIGTGGLAILVYGIGVVHAFRDFKPKITVTNRSEKKLTTQHLAPIVAPGTVGLGATWEF